MIRSTSVVVVTLLLACVTPATGLSQGKEEKKVAFVKVYAPDLTPSPACKDLGAALEARGYEVNSKKKLGKDYDPAVFEVSISQLDIELSKWLIDNKDAKTVVVYLDGHGWLAPSGTTILSAFDDNLRLWFDVDEEKLQNRLGDHSAKEKLLILDCCRSDFCDYDVPGAIDHWPPDGEWVKKRRSERKLAEQTCPRCRVVIGYLPHQECPCFGKVVPTAHLPRDIVTFYAVRKHSVGISPWINAREKGALFGTTLAKGLGGEADLNDDKVIKVDELFKFAFYDILVPDPNRKSPFYKQHSKFYLPDREPAIGKTPNFSLGSLQ